MGHFIIQLPDNSEWNVRFGYVKRKNSFDIFIKSKLNNDKKKGYIIFNKSQQKEYRLLKNLDGKWIDRAEAGFQAANDETSVFIQKAIDEFEKKI